jgi:hypothetical protein
MSVTTTPSPTAPAQTQKKVRRFKNQFVPI